MGGTSSIEWTEATWNPIRGCSKVSSGCAHCYAEAMASRFNNPGQPYDGLTTGGRWNGTVRMIPEHLEDPLRWRKPRRIFVNSMSDLFHEALSFEEIAMIFGVMAAAPHHTFQVLTKRAARMVEFYQWVKGKGKEINPFDRAPVRERMVVLMSKFDLVNEAERLGPWPLPNLWVGVSVEDQASADERIPLLLQVPAAVRWVSCEPLLGPVDFSGKVLADMCGGTYPFPVLEDRFQTKRIDWLDWVVAGGEGGPNARPMQPEWARRLRDQCSVANVPFLFKQWGEFCAPEQLPDHVFREWDAIENAAGNPNLQVPVRVGKKAAGRLLDGAIHDAYPAMRRETAC